MRPANACTKAWRPGSRRSRPARPARPRAASQRLEQHGLALGAAGHRRRDRRGTRARRPPRRASMAGASARLQPTSTTRAGKPGSAHASSSACRLVPRPETSTPTRSVSAPKIDALAPARHDAADLDRVGSSTSGRPRPRPCPRPMLNTRSISSSPCRRAPGAGEDRRHGPGAPVELDGDVVGQDAREVAGHPAAGDVRDRLAARSASAATACR